MAYKKLPDDLPAILRSYGLKVTAVPGWRKRGRPASTGDFDPAGVLCHDSVTSTKWTIAAVLRLLIGGRKDLAGPLCQLGLSRRGRVYIIAAGRANHAGWAKSSGTVGSGDGNMLYIGIEGFNNGVDETWSEDQYKAYQLLCAILSVVVTKNSFQTVRGHKETSITGKVDPTFDMDVFRGGVESKMVEIAAPKTKMLKKAKKIKKSVSTLAVEVIDGKWGNGPERVRRLRAAGYNPDAVQKEVNRRL